MSFIMQTYRCKKCHKEINVALGTFGFGMPTTCEKCGITEWELIADGWNAQKPQSIESRMSTLETVIQLSKLLGGIIIIALLTLIYLK